MSKYIAIFTCALFLVPSIALGQASTAADVFDPTAYATVTPPTTGSETTADSDTPSDTSDTTFDFATDANPTAAETTARTTNTAAGAIDDLVDDKVPTDTSASEGEPNPTVDPTLPPLPLFDSSITLTKKTTVSQTGATHAAASVVNIPAGDGALHASFWSSVKDFVGIPEFSFGGSEPTTETPLALTGGNTLTVNANGQVITTKKIHLTEVGPTDTFAVAALIALALASFVSFTLCRVHA